MACLFSLSLVVSSLVLVIGQWISSLFILLSEGSYIGWKEMSNAIQLAEDEGLPVEY